MDSPDNYMYIAPLAKPNLGWVSHVRLINRLGLAARLASQVLFSISLPI